MFICWFILKATRFSSRRRMRFDGVSSSGIALADSSRVERYAYATDEAIESRSASQHMRIHHCAALASRLIAHDHRPPLQIPASEIAQERLLLLPEPRLQLRPCVRSARLGIVNRNALGHCRLPEGPVQLVLVCVARLLAVTLRGAAQFPVRRGRYARERKGEARARGSSQGGEVCDERENRQTEDEGQCQEG